MESDEEGASVMNEVGKSIWFRGNAWWTWKWPLKDKKKHYQLKYTDISSGNENKELVRVVDSVRVAIGILFLHYVWRILTFNAFADLTVDNSATYSINNVFRRDAKLQKVYSLNVYIAPNFMKPFSFTGPTYLFYRFSVVHSKVSESFLTRLSI